MHSQQRPIICWSAINEIWATSTCNPPTHTHSHKQAYYHRHTLTHTHIFTHTHSHTWAWNKSPSSHFKLLVVAHIKILLVVIIRISNYSPVGMLTPALLTWKGLHFDNSWVLRSGTLVPQFPAEESSRSYWPDFDLLGGVGHLTPLKTISPGLLLVWAIC